MGPVEVKVTYIANAGVMITFGQTKVFIDALHSKKTPIFQTVKEPLLGRIIRGDNGFKDVDYLLFTHTHKDHFGHEAVLAYLRNNKCKALIVPEDAGQIISRATEGESAEQGVINIMNPDYDLKAELEHDNIRIKYFRLNHMGEQYQNVLNYSFLVEIGGFNILHLGDGGFEPVHMQKMLEGEIVHCALLNFPFVTLPRGREIISRIIKPRQIIIIHLPSVEDDQFNYNLITSKTINKYQGILPQTDVFSEPLQEIVLKP